MLNIQKSLRHHAAHCDHNMTDVGSRLIKVRLGARKAIVKYHKFDLLAEREVYEMVKKDAYAIVRNLKIFLLIKRIKIFELVKKSNDEILIH